MRLLQNDTVRCFVPKRKARAANSRFAARASDLPYRVDPPIRPDLPGGRVLSDMDFVTTSTCEMSVFRVFNDMRNVTPFCNLMLC